MYKFLFDYQFMYLLNHFKTFFGKSPEQHEHFELIINEILEEPPSQDFIVLGESGNNQYVEQEGIQNMYLKEFLLIDRKCEGRALTVEEWREVIKTSDISIFSKKDIYLSVYKGIDFKIRKSVWQVLANTAQMKKLASLNFEQLCQVSRLPPGEIDIIDKDVRRTECITRYLPELRRILVGYVNLTGGKYTQGMNVIGGFLLKVLAIENDSQLVGHSIIQEQFSERVFWVLIGVMKWKSWSQLYEANLAGLERMIGILHRLMTQHVPKILKCIEQQGWDLNIFAQYYITICLNNCPPELSPIILDLFLLDGETIVHSLLIRMMVINEKTILSFKDESHLMKYLKSEMLNDTYLKLIKNRVSADCLQDFQINFIQSVF